MNYSRTAVQTWDLRSRSSGATKTHVCIFFKSIQFVQSSIHTWRIVLCGTSLWSRRTIQYSVSKSFHYYYYYYICYYLLTNSYYATITHLQNYTWIPMWVQNSPIDLDGESDGFGSLSLIRIISFCILLYNTIKSPFSWRITLKRKENYMYSKNEGCNKYNKT